MFKKSTYFISVPVIVCATIMAYMLGTSDAKVSNYQQVSISCTVSGDPDSEACNQLTLFGLYPLAFLTDKNYKKEVDALYLEAAQRNTSLAPFVANFTLDYGYKNKIKIPVEIIKELRDLAEKE